MDILNGHSLWWVAGLFLSLALTGVIAGVLAGLLGVGGGIVIVPVLYNLFSLLGVDESVKMHVAVGTSLATIVPTSFMSARSHAAKGNLDKDLLKSLAWPLFGGVIIGSFLSGYFKGPVLSGIFGVVGLLVALNMAFRSKSAALADQLPAAPWKQVIGAIIGGFSTLMGIGGGTLSVPIFTAFNVPVHKAVGTAAAIGLVISIPGALGFIMNGLHVAHRPPFTFGYVNLIGFALIVPMTMWMAPVGAKLASRTKPDRLKQAFAFFLFLTSIKMLYSLLTH